MLSVWLTASESAAPGGLCRLPIDGAPDDQGMVESKQLENRVDVNEKQPGSGEKNHNKVGDSDKGSAGDKADSFDILNGP